MATPIPSKVSAFWQDFLSSCQPDNPEERFYEAFHFCDNEAAANELADLVLAGTKTATAALVWGLEAERKPAPWPGALSIVTDWEGKPLCVIETVQVDIVAFAKVSAEFAAMEGEGDKSLAYWRDGHWRYFSRECAQIGRTPAEDMPIVCERFRVVYEA